MSETLAARAQATLHDWVQSESLRKHCYAVADSMKHFAQLRGEDADLWEAVGLLHDVDYERHPSVERSATAGHPFVGVAWLRKNRATHFLAPTVLAQPRDAHKRMAFGGAAFEIRMALIIHVMQ